MEHLDLPAHRIPFELLDGVFARLDRQVGEELSIRFSSYSFGVFCSWAWMTVKVQSWVSLLACQRAEGSRILRYRISRMASSRSPLSSRTSMRWAAPLLRSAIHFVGNSMISISSQAIDASPYQENAFQPPEPCKTVHRCRCSRSPIWMQRPGSSRSSVDHVLSSSSHRMLSFFSMGTRVGLIFLLSAAVPLNLSPESRISPRHNPSGNPAVVIARLECIKIPQAV